MQVIDGTSREARRRKHGRHLEVWGGVPGAALGAAMGGLAGGIPGVIAGAVVGAAMGAATGWAAHRGTNDAADRDSQLDLDIGVTGPDLGAPHLKHPPSKVGAYSLAASGAGALRGEEEEQAEGPIQPPPA